MNNCAIVNVIVEALENYENDHKISILESRLHFMEKEAIIRHLEEGNIDLLRDYFKIGK